MILHHGLLCGAMIICLRMFWCSSAKGIYFQVTSLSSTTLYSTKLIDKVLSELLELGQARYQYETKQKKPFWEWSKKSGKNENHSLLISEWMPEVKVVSSSLTFHERNSTQLRKIPPRKSRHPHSSDRFFDGLLSCLLTCLHSELKRKKTHWLSY